MWCHRCDTDTWGFISSQGGHASSAWTFAKCNLRDAPYLSRSASHTFNRVGCTIYSHLSPIWAYAGWCVCLRVCRRAHEVLLGVLLLSPGVYSVCVLVARRLIIQYQQECVPFFVRLHACVFECVVGSLGHGAQQEISQREQEQQKRWRGEKQYGSVLLSMWANFSPSAQRLPKFGLEVDW